MGPSTPHGRLLAGEAGALAGVSGTTIGQWARRGFIASSQSIGEPRVYAVEDVAEAIVVAELLARGVGHGELHRAVGLLGGYGPWPLSEALLGTTDERPPRIVLYEDGAPLVMGPRGWQALTETPLVREVRLRLRRVPADDGARLPAPDPRP